MILYPAIDLKNGSCVRLVQGSMDKVDIYNNDPVDQARNFANAGAEWLHVVDLDGAVTGSQVNIEAVAAVLDAVTIPIQLGGGVRDMGTIERWLEAGIKRVILGTVAVKSPELVERACERYPGQIAVAIDARDGLVAVSGWTELSALKPEFLAKRCERAGAATIIFTDISRDGTLSGINAKATAALAKTISIPVIASGGVASLVDLHTLKALEHEGVAGVIAGRALYDGRLDLADSLAVLAR